MSHFTTTTTTLPKGACGKIFNTQAATLLKTTLLHGCFSRLLDCANDTKLRKSSHAEFCGEDPWDRWNNP